MSDRTPAPSSSIAPYVPPSPPGSVPVGVPRSAPQRPYTSGTYRAGSTSTAAKPTKVTVLPPLGQLVVSRFTAGTTTDVVAAVDNRGALGWFDRQLTPSQVPDEDGANLVGWWPHLKLSPQEIWRRNINGDYPGWMQMRDLAGLQMTRRIRSSRQVFETLGAFWENHLHIPNNSDSFVWRYHYGETVREHALGRFEDLLKATAVHPAMLIWLDGDRSTKVAPNENLGRELLELYTVGVGNYTEDDVKNAAKILTGWHVDTWNTWEASYRTEDHWTGPVKVGSFEHDNASADGRAVTMAFLRYLARHRDTAERLCRKLATKFVSDSPTDGLVQRLADVYQAKETAIAPVLRALVRSPEFKGSAGKKLRDPVEDVLAVYRALRTTLAPPKTDRAATVTMVWQSNDLGLMQNSWPRPDGAPLTGEPWSTPLRALASTNLHWAMAGGWWVPRYPITLRDLIDHVSKLVLGVPADRALLESARTFLDYDSLGERITGPDHPVVRWQMPRLLVAVLDSPGFYQR